MHFAVYGTHTDTLLKLLDRAISFPFFTEGVFECNIANQIFNLWEYYVYDE